MTTQSIQKTTSNTSTRATSSADRMDQLDAAIEAESVRARPRAAVMQRLGQGVIDSLHPRREPQRTPTALNAVLDRVGASFARGDADDALTVLRAFVTTRPTIADERIARSVMATIWLRTGEYELARATADHVLAHLKDPGGTLPAELAFNLWQTGADACRGLRDFAAGTKYTENAVKAARMFAAQGDKDFIRGALFSHAVMLKNAGDIRSAARVMGEAHDRDPKNVPTAIAYAGYLALAGDAQRGNAIFRAVDIPKEGGARLDYFTNAAWLAALKNDFEGFLSAAKEAIVLDFDRNFASYLAVEVDFDKFRAEPRFKQLAAWANEKA